MWRLDHECITLMHGEVNHFNPVFMHIYAMDLSVSKIFSPV